MQFPFLSSVFDLNQFPRAQTYEIEDRIASDTSHINPFPAPDIPIQVSEAVPKRISFVPLTKEVP
jgi:hypothetical protein